ncbi:hypothetical protein LguiB_007186 [Lonicera macranthoides]
MERPPLYARHSIRLETKRLMDEFINYKPFEEGSPIEKHALQIIEVGRLLQKCGKNILESDIIDKIVDTLPPTWNEAISKIFQYEHPTCAVELLKCLQEAERDINPLWIEFEKGKMNPECRVKDHILRKEQLLNQLRREGFYCPFRVVVYSIVNTLPSTWPMQRICEKLQEDLLDLKELEEYLEDVELDMICNKLFENMESQLLNNNNDQ